MSKTGLITLEQIKSSRDFRELIRASNANLEQMGYTEHGLRHVGYVSRTTAGILREVGSDPRIVELGAIAGWIHDIGNAVNRHNHGPTGATLAFDLLLRMRMPMSEIAAIIAAVGNHEEQTGLPVNQICAALIIADKSDAHRTRVRQGKFDISDIHDRVNLSIKKNYLVVDPPKRVIRLVIFMDTEISAPMEYLQIYLSRMILCERSATFFDYTFELVINDTLINHHKKLKLDAVSSVDLAGKVVSD